NDELGGQGNTEVHGRVVAVRGASVKDDADDVGDEESCRKGTLVDETICGAQLAEWDGRSSIVEAHGGAGSCECNDEQEDGELPDLDGSVASQDVGPGSREHKHDADNRPFPTQRMPGCQSRHERSGNNAGD